MREKLKYTPLAIVCIVADICLFIGALFTYLPFGRLRSGNFYSAIGAVQGGYQLAIYIMMLAAAAIIVLSVFKLMYFIMRERKPAVIISAATGAAGVVLILVFFSQLISMVMNLSSMLYGGLSAYSSILSYISLMVIALIFIVLSAAFDVVILLCMRGTIKAEGLRKLMPALKKDETGISKRPVLMNIINALIFSAVIIVVSIRLSAGNVMGILSSILTWAIFLIAGIFGIVAVAVMMFIADRKYGRNKLMFINTIVNTVLGAVAILGMLFSLIGGTGSIGGGLYLIMLLIAVADAILQIGLILCIMDVIKIKGLDGYIAQVAASETVKSAEETEAPVERAADALKGASETQEAANEPLSETPDGGQDDRAAEDADSSGNEAPEHTVAETDLTPEKENEEHTEKIAEAVTGSEPDIAVPAGGTGDDGMGNDNSPEADVSGTEEAVPEKEKFLKTKKGKITLAVIAAVVVIAIALIIWAVFFNKTEIDAFDDIQIEFTGENGHGYADVQAGNIDYDMMDSNVAMFVNSLYYDVENNGELSNGDKVKVTVQYSEMTADGLGIKIKDESKEFEVSGLVEKYASAADIDSDIYDKAYKAATDELEARAYGDEQNKFYKAYYVTEENGDGTYGDNKLVFVFQQTYEEYDFASNKDVDKTRYVAMYTNFDSGYDEDSYYMYSVSLTVPDTFNYVEKKDDILPALKDEFKSYLDDYNVKVEEVNLSM